MVNQTDVVLRHLLLPLLPQRRSSLALTSDFLSNFCYQTFYTK